MLTPLDFKAARVRADLTQQQVAEALGIQQSHLSEFEAGKRELPPEKQHQLLLLILKAQETLRFPKESRES